MGKVVSLVTIMGKCDCCVYTGEKKPPVLFTHKYNAKWSNHKLKIPNIKNSKETE